MTKSVSGAHQRGVSRPQFSAAGAAVACEQSRSHSELVVFAIAAVVLFGFMLRM